jgi:DNA-binding response OmpR family regulator
MVGIKNLKTLLVAKNELLRESVEMYLDSKGFEVFATGSFEAALEHLRQQTSALIISEHGRSSADALAFFRAIKKLRLASQAYKIIVCDSCPPESGCDGLEQYADFCISKPLTKESVDQIVRHIDEDYGEKNQRGHERSKDI